MTQEYIQVEFHLAAIRAEDLVAVQRALRKVRDQYARGGSSIDVSDVTEDTVIVRG